MIEFHQLGDSEMYKVIIDGVFGGNIFESPSCEYQFSGSMSMVSFRASDLREIADKLDELNLY